MELRSRGEDAVLVWDLDGTLVDARPRMLRAVHMFGRPEVQLQDVHHTWQQTAQHLGLHAEAFHACWNDVFWDPASFLLDLPVDETVWLARWAESLGVPNIILTGRLDENQSLTWEQLTRLGLSPRDVITKPSLGLGTPEFKAQQLQKLLEQGQVPGAFLTDSPAEIAAAHAQAAGVTLVFCALDGTSSHGIPPGIPLWSTGAAPSGTGDMLLPLGLPLSPWMLHATAQELDADHPRTLVPGPTRTRSQFDAMSTVMGWDPAGAVAALDRVRRTACEHVLNDRDGRARVMDGNLDASTARGQPFWLPLVSVPAERAVVLRSKRFPTSHLDTAFLHGGGCALPIHPQELPHREDATVVTSLKARSTASGRTVRTSLVGHPHALLKCDLSHVFMDRHPRSLSIRDAELAIRHSDFLAACLEESDIFCFLPEIMAVGDGEADSACVVRSAEPVPAAAPGAWTIPAYCLWAPAQSLGSAHPLIIGLLRKMGPDALCSAIFHPLIAAMMRLTLDFGCAYLGHGQNIHVEIANNGLPTGRFVFTDMEDVWPHPALCTALSLPYPVDTEYRQAHAESRESGIATTFQDYFLWKLLQPLLQCLETEPGHSLRDNVNQLIRLEVLARADTVCAFRTGPLKWFYDTYLAEDA